MRLIVTRPEPDATRTGRALIALGHVAILSPMIEIFPDASVLLPELPFQAVLATSANGVRALAAHPAFARISGLPCFAVGDQTALEAKRAGFAKARSAGGALEQFVGFTAAEMHPGLGPVLYAAGDVQAGDLAGQLGSRGFDVRTVVVYRAAVRPTLSGVATEALRAGGVDGILLYSRRSAAAFALALRAAGLAPLGSSVTCFCLSAAVSEPLPSVSRGPIKIAERPDQISLFALIERNPYDAAGRPAPPG